MAPAIRAEEREEATIEREAKKRKPDEKEVEALKDFEQEAKERRRQAGVIEDEAASDPPDEECSPSIAGSGNMEIGDDTLLQDYKAWRKTQDANQEIQEVRRSEGGTVEASPTKN